VKYIPIHCEDPTFQFLMVNKHIYIRFEVFKEVIMKSAVFWGIEARFMRHRRHITTPLQSPATRKQCKILGIHGGDYEGSPLGCDAVWLLYFLVACFGC
jgi:hypothetical protein